MDKKIPTVLILDDDDVVRESLFDYFEDRGWCVLSASSAEEALTMLEKETPTGAVVDIRLPGMDGNRFIRMTNKLQMPIAYIVVTGSPKYHLPRDVLKMRAVCDTVFLKPILKLTALEEALLRQIEICRVKDDDHE
jgi:FixJ family two-component response regulator